jgi:hypothetical protein
MIKILKKHENNSVIRNSDLKKGNKFAVIAVFPRKETTTSTLRLIQSLQKNNFNIVVVINKSILLTEIYVSSFKSLNLTILTRPNIGRDFGAYQAGFNFLVKNDLLSSASQIIFANDSVFYGPKSHNFIDKSLRNSAHWNSFFVNYQFHQHAQSFFISFPSEIINSKIFLDFWTSYYPTSLRHRVINSGEVKLSQVLQQGGYALKACISPDSAPWSKYLKSITPDELFGLWSGFGFQEVVAANMRHGLNQLRFQHVLIEANPTHHLGLFISRFTGAPLKLDLLKTGLVSFAGILNTLGFMGVPKKEIDGLTTLILAGGSVTSTKGMAKLWRDYGYL